MLQPALCGRAGLARILDCAERTTRGLEAAGEIAPEMIVGGRPLFSVEKAVNLKNKRDAARMHGSGTSPEPRAA
jgi:hypothetical protein